MGDLLSTLLGGGLSDEAMRARLSRLERKIDLVMQALCIELPAHSREEEIAAGRLINAVRLVREITGTGLAEAKRAVDDGSWPELLRLSGG